MKRLSVDASRIIFVALIISASVGRADYSAEGEVHLRGLEIEVLKNNPRIKAAVNLAQAARHRIIPARWLDDPVFSYGYFGESLQTRVGPQKNLFQLSQKFPLGKLSLRGKMAARGASAAEEIAEAVTWEVLTDFRKGYFDLWWVGKALRITAEEMEVVERLEKIAQAKYATGKATQQDVLKAQLRLSRLKDRELQLEQQRQTLLAHLNRLLDHPPDTPWGSLEEIKPIALNISLDSLYEMAKVERPSLQVQQFEVEKAQYGVKLAQRQYIPDLTLGARYFQIGNGDTTSPDDGTDAWMITAGINLPLWFWKTREEIREAAARLEAVRDSYQTEVNNASFEVKDRYFKLTTAREQLELYEKNLLPQARQAFQASRAGYEAGQVDFLSLLDSEEALLKVRLAYLRAIADYRKYVAELEKAVGKKLVDEGTGSSDQ